VPLALGLGSLLSYIIPGFGVIVVLFAAPVGVIYGIIGVCKGPGVQSRVLAAIGLLCSILALVLLFGLGIPWLPGPPYDDPPIEPPMTTTDWWTTLNGLQ